MTDRGTRYKRRHEASRVTVALKTADEMMEKRPGTLYFRDAAEMLIWQIFSGGGWRHGARFNSRHFHFCLTAAHAQCGGLDRESRGDILPKN